MLSEAQKLSLAFQMTLAVQELHSKNIVHGDLYPSNFIIQWNPLGAFRVKIIDFGCSQLVSKMQPMHTGVLKGVRNYRVPQNKYIHNGTISASTDIYALGIILGQDLQLKTQELVDRCTSQEEPNLANILTLLNNTAKTELPRDNLTIRLMSMYQNRCLNVIRENLVGNIILQIALKMRENNLLPVKDSSTGNVLLIKYPSDVFNENAPKDGEEISYSGTKCICISIRAFAEEKYRSASITQLIKHAEDKSKLNEVKKDILYALKHIVKFTDNIEELYMFFIQLKKEEYQSPILRKETDFFRFDAGTTILWKNALTIFKTRALELAQNEANMHQVISAPDKYKAILQEQTTRLFPDKLDDLKAFDALEQSTKPSV